MNVKVLVRCEKRGVARRAELNGARSAQPASALRQRTVVRTSVGGGMQLHYTDAAHVGRNRVMESLRFADCSALRAVSKAESTEQRPAEAAHIYRK